MIVNTYGFNANAKNVEFNVLLGKTVTEIQGAEAESEEIIFTCSDGTKYVMYHEQDCCEYVAITDVCGDVNSLIGCQIYMAEESSNSDTDEAHDEPLNRYDNSFTWTFYKLATIKGYVTIRWYGESNGYYSESVDFVELINPSSQN